MTTPLLEVQDLKKHYPVSGRLPVGGVRPVVRSVDGVSLQIPAGATLGLIGEAGSGKTTTAKMLLRLEPPTSGKILFEGQEVQHAKGRALRAYRSEVQAVFQDPYSSLNPRRKVFDAIAEPLVASKTMTRAQIA